ncbi:major histocompatibility complex class I-related gene protein-like [Polymixia lowei]
MKEVILLLLFFDVASPVRHSLKYFDTGSSGLTNFPEFVVVGMVDELQIVHYDSNTQRAELKQDWMNKLTADVPQYLEGQTRIAMVAQQNFKASIDVAKQRFNQTGGVHLVQRMYGCEWDNETGDTDGYYQFGYDGEDFISLDLKTLTWIAPTPQAFTTKLKWDRTGAELAQQKNYLNTECVEWVKKYVDYGKSVLQRTVRPSVSLLQKSPSSPVTCHATGFYPDRVMVFWRRDGEELHEHVDHGELLTNQDGTFQMSVHLDLSSVTPDDWKRYECVVQLSGVKDDIITKLDQSGIGTNWGKTGIPADGGFPTGLVIGGVIGLILLLVICMAGLFIWRKTRNGFKPANTSETDSDNPLEVPVLTDHKEQRRLEEEGELLQDQQLTKK